MEFNLKVDLQNERFINYNDTINRIRNASIANAIPNGYILNFINPNEDTLFSLRCTKDYNVYQINDLAITDYNYEHGLKGYKSTIFEQISFFSEQPDKFKHQRTQFDILINITSEAIRFKLVQNFFSNLQASEYHDFGDLFIIYKNWSSCLSSNGKNIPRTVENASEHRIFLNTLSMLDGDGPVYKKALEKLGLTF